MQFGGCSAPNTMKNEGGKRTSIITVERSKACSEGDVIWNIVKNVMKRPIVLVEHAKACSCGDVTGARGPDPSSRPVHPHQMAASTTLEIQ